MFSIPLPWGAEFKFPGSEQNQQWIAPVTNWLSPTVVTYAGDRGIEARVVTEIASFGKQLGILTDALLEIADDRPSEAVTRLRRIANRIEAVKIQHSRDLEERAEEAFDELLKADPAAAMRLVALLEQKATPADGDPAS